MSLEQALLLGVLQGVTEFLPISSSAHLVILPWLLGWTYQGLAIDVALHAGTLLAIVLYFFKDWCRLLKEGILNPKGTWGRLFWFLAVASFPGALAGYFFETQAETVFRHPAVIASTLIGAGLLLGLADRYSTQKYTLQEVSFLKTLGIGLAQALAIVPGVSRSGATLTAGLAAGLSRESAARFSFLLATPIMLGAGLIKLPDLTFQDLTLPFWVGVGSAAGVGYLAIRFLLSYLKRSSCWVFVWYRVVLGLGILLWSVLRR